MTPDFTFDPRKCGHGAELHGTTEWRDCENCRPDLYNPDGSYRDVPVPEPDGPVVGGYKKVGGWWVRRS